MPAVCTCTCGLDVEDGDLCVDWATIGMHRQCDVAEPYSNNLSSLSSSPEWFQLRDVITNWTNPSCRTHRAVVRAQLPYVLIKTGENNSWQVRLFIDGAIGMLPVLDDTREPELHWSSVWSGGLPIATDQEQQTPGSAQREFLVPPGATLFTWTRVQARVPVLTPRPQNLLEFGTLRVSVSAWPAKVDSGSGRTC